MHLPLKHCIGGLALCAMALPLWAHTDSATISVTQRTTIEGTQLKPGTYQIKIPQNGDQMKVVTAEGKVVAQVPCHWVTLKEKPSDTEVVFQRNRITEVEFGGKTQAAKVG